MSNGFWSLADLRNIVKKPFTPGISLAQKYEAKLFVIHVMHNPFMLEGWNSIPSLTRNMQDYSRHIKMTLIA